MVKKNIKNKENRHTLITIVALLYIHILKQDYTTMITKTNTAGWNEESKFLPILQILYIRK